MLRILLDTNILIDYMVPDRPDSSSAAIIVEAIGTGTVEAVVCASSLKDVYYIVRKEYADPLVRDYLAAFMDLMDVAPVDRAACSVALASNEPDFEDGIVRAIGEAAKVDLVITRDTKAFKRSTIKAMSPLTFANLIAN